MLLAPLTVCVPALSLNCSSFHLIQDHKTYIVLDIENQNTNSAGKKEPGEKKRHVLATREAGIMASVG